MWGWGTVLAEKVNRLNFSLVNAEMVMAPNSVGLFPSSFKTTAIFECCGDSYNVGYTVYKVKVNYNFNEIC